MVDADDAHWRFKGLLGRVEPHLAQLERAGVLAMWRDEAGLHAIQQDRLAVPSRGLLRNGVWRVTAFPEICRGDSGPHTHRIQLSTSGGGQASGSDATLGQVEDELNARADNYDKLIRAGAAQSHLFVWLDWDTPYEIARPLGHQNHLNDMDHFGLPSRPPQLNPCVDHLWIVHRGTRRGWHWDGITWHDVSPTSE